MKHAIFFLMIFVVCFGGLAASVQGQDCPADKVMLSRSVAPVIVLFLVSSPTDVSRFVVPVIVDSVKGVIGTGTPANGVDKFRNGSEAKFYSTSAIVAEASVLCIRATLLSGVVATKLARWFMVQAFSVGDCRQTGTLLTNTPAGRVSISKQIGSGGSEKRPAVAPSKPANFTCFRSIVNTQNQDVTQTLAGQVFEITSGWNERFKWCS